MSCKDNRRTKNFERKLTHRKKGNNFKDSQRQTLIDIYYDTQKYCLSRWSWKSGKAIQKSICYNINDIDIPPNSPTESSSTDLSFSSIKTELIIENEDTLNMTVRFCNEGFKPLVLNMASKYKPGGGVETGKNAQEEVLFKRTNLLLALPDHWYPLEDTEAIYSPLIHIIKDSNYEFIDEKDQQVAAFIAVHAIKNPKLYHGSYSDADKELMEAKIESIFKLGILYGHDSLVLGALGCGAYRNPAPKVIQIFKKMLVKYDGFFKRIGFAILVVGDSGQSNFDLFKNELG